MPIDGNVNMVKNDRMRVEQQIFRIFGLDEKEIGLRLQGIQEGVVPVRITVRSNFPEFHLEIKPKGRGRAGRMGLERALEIVRDRLGAFIFSSTGEPMEMRVGNLLTQEGLTLSAAESCTGGLIGHLLTEVPGSSRYFQGGAVVYSNASKISLLEVSEDTIQRFGAVSDKTAREMARGVRLCFNTDLALAVTGIAGPDGGSEDKPVGTVHLALASGDEIISQKYLFRGTRKRVKLQTAMMALDWVRRYICGYSFLSGL
jgi:nicotinamide-nucleotide amidase